MRRLRDPFAIRKIVIFLIICMVFHTFPADHYFLCLLLFPGGTNCLLRANAYAVWFQRRLSQLAQEELLYAGGNNLL